MPVNEDPRTSGDETPPHPRIPAIHRLLPFALILATVAAYAQVLGFDFISLDDAPYVVLNPHLSARLSLHTLKWIFLSFSPDNWFPVTRLSLLTDYKLFGLRAGFYHVENLVIHCAAALLLFAFLRRATRQLWPAAFAAFVFALHPLHVESVAWIAERKDVLCGFFWFAALLAWVRYTERPGTLRYLGALALFSLGLMSKPMIVTLPFLLLLLDVWPLRRGPWTTYWREKLPFFLLSGAVMAITIAAQRSAGAVREFTAFPAPLRMENALTSVAIYLADTLWPAHLWAIYAYPASIPPLQWIGAAAGIAAISAVAFRQRAARPWLATGWFWFLVTLLPVIGLVQVGSQARADRYMYVPMTGLAIVLAWGADEAVRRRPARRRVVAALAVAACLAMGIRTWQQTQYWKDTGALLTHAIEMDGQNYEALTTLGSGAAVYGNPDNLLQAILRQREAVKLRPDIALLHNNLGFALSYANRPDEAIAEFRQALRLDPGYTDARSNLAETLMKAGRAAEAIAEAEQVLRLNPRFSLEHNNLGIWLCRTPGRFDEGLRHLEIATEIDPDYWEAQSNLGHALLTRPDRLADAIARLQEVLRITPDSAAAHLELARALDRVPGMQLEAQDQRDEAMRLQRLNTGPR